MEKFCTILGEVIITAAMFAVPILCTCSIALDWGFDAKTFLIFLSVVDYIVTWWCVQVSIGDI